MIVIPEITLDAMKSAVERLAGEGYFEHLRPLTEADVAASNPHQWPPRLAPKMPAIDHIRLAMR
jgi:hypothetical protein